MIPWFKLLLQLELINRKTHKTLKSAVWQIFLLFTKPECHLNAQKGVFKTYNNLWNNIFHYGRIYAKIPVKEQK